MEPIVVVHGGASEWYSGTGPGRAACRRAAEAGHAALAAGGTALDAVIAAVRVVEVDPVCNAGINFRINASTPPLLVLNALAASRGPSWEGRGRWQTYRHGFARPGHALRHRLPKASLIPTASYDPAFTDNGPGPSLLSALLLATTSRTCSG